MTLVDVLRYRVVLKTLPILASLTTPPKATLGRGAESDETHVHEAKRDAA